MANVKYSTVEYLYSNDLIQLMKPNIQIYRFTCASVYFMDYN